MIFSKNTIPNPTKMNFTNWSIHGPSNCLTYKKKKKKALRFQELFPLKMAKHK